MMEILAPAGSAESLLAAVRCGANAVYIGGKSLNARRNAANFDDTQLEEAVAYCHARGVKVYLTLNTLVFDHELPLLLDTIKTACRLGIDALITQDLAAAGLAREYAPDMPLHASTQMGIHNKEGAKQLGELGFSRVVLARELTQAEIAEIAAASPLALECFVHGALCMCVSGSCYLSAMIGGRSGNRGLCAQPCRLKFSGPGKEYALSLKDLTLIDKIAQLQGCGVTSLKIEGRMKRPEYVAAAVTACKQALAGLKPDIAQLSAVFSRSGFTAGYFEDNRGEAMFGVRQKEDVLSADTTLLNRLAQLYKDENPLVPVEMELFMQREQPAGLELSDIDGNRVSVTGDVPQQARTAPTTPERAEAALAKTGGTPFAVTKLTANLDDGLMLPASALNAMRRDALSQLECIRAAVKAIPFADKALPHFARYTAKAPPELRVRVANAAQLTPQLAESAALLIIPAAVLRQLDAAFYTRYSAKIAVEIPRILFNGKDKLDSIIQFAKQQGVTHAVAGSLGAVWIAQEHGLFIHGDFGLNITNSLALQAYEALRLADVTLSMELTRVQIAGLGASLARGILAYGFLPLMITRNCPIGDCKACQKEKAALVDRKGNRFTVQCGWGVAEVLNFVPLVLSERMREFTGIDFYTLYFTNEAPARCDEVLAAYQNQMNLACEKTRGLYYREVL